MIWELLEKAEGHFLTTDQVMEMTGLKEREVRRQVHRERKAGREICTQRNRPGGYFMPKDEGDLRNTLKIIVSQGMNTFVTARPFREGLSQVPGQISLDDMDQEEGRDEDQEDEDQEQA